MPNEFASVHPIFYFYMLKKCYGVQTSLLPLEGFGFDKNLSYEKVPRDFRSTSQEDKK